MIIIETDKVAEENFKPTLTRDVLISKEILAVVFGEGYAQRFAVQFWDGSIVGNPVEAPFTLLLNGPGTLRVALRAPVDLNAGRAFVAGLLDCRGNLESALDEMFSATNNLSLRKAALVLLLSRRLPKVAIPRMQGAKLRGKQHSRERDRAAVGFHYNQPVDFYASFLDSELVYSCGYYDDGVADLDEAQIRKIDYTLAKVRLGPGERLLDIGCGWGALVIRAAQQFGASSLGITLSTAQYEEAQRRIERAGVGHLARVELRDYRDLPKNSFDKCVSIGMFEHVGACNLPHYFRTVFDLLRPGGLFLNHGIAEQSRGRRGGKVSGFLERFVFPDGELVAVSRALSDAERYGFEVRDVENLREHYAQTLRHWVRNLESNRERAFKVSDAHTYRIWRLYMAGSAQGFRSGRLGLFQSLLAKPTLDGSVSVPATRRDLYADGALVRSAW
ncbi:MAG: class I SAM-dependent methyltransferase [Candidatus Tyrphobacter sp.]